MAQNSDYHIPRLEAKLFFGLSTDVAGNAHYLTDTQILHPAGQTLVIDSLTEGAQRFIKVPPSRKEISVISVSSDRKTIVVGERGERPTLSVYEVASLRRLKLLGVPGAAGAGDWAGVGFLEGGQQLAAVTSAPAWLLLLYHWPRGKVLYSGPASPRGLPVTQVLPNPEDSTVLAIVGDGLFRLLSQSDSSWRQYGFSRADRVPLRMAAWIGSQQLLAGSFDGRLLIIDYGELRAVYHANQLTELCLSETVSKNSETVTLASQVVLEEDKNGLHEVRALVAFEKGFLYSCNVGEVFVFEKTEHLRWVKKNIIKIPSSLPEGEYKKYFKINFASVSPSNERLVVTTKKTELYMSNLFKSEQEKDKSVTEFELDGTGYHAGRIVALSTCLWKPIFLTAGAHDKTIRLWDYESLKVTIIKKFSDEIYSAALHPSGFFCLLGFTDKLRFMLILVNDFKTIRHVDIRGCQNVAFSSGGHIFAATREQVVEVYSAIDFTHIHSLHGHLGPVMRVVFGPRDKSLWSCGAEGSLYEWDMESGRRLGDIFTNKNGQLGLAINEAVYTVGTDGNLKEIINGEISREVEMQQSSLTCVALGSSGQMLFLGGEKSAVVSVVYPLVHPPNWKEFTMHSQPLSDIVVSHDDSTLITTSEDGFLCIWRILRGEEAAENGGLGHVKEVLLSLEELEGMRAGIKELSDRLQETEGEHEYAIRQITATNQTALKETNNTYTAIVDDLKFRIKQMDREHLVEINKFQNKLKNEKGSHGDSMDQLEKRYSEKLLAELRRIEELENLLEKSKQDYQTLKTQMDEKLNSTLAQLQEEKRCEIEEKQRRILELEDKLMTMVEDKEQSKLILEEEFNKKKEDVGKSFITKILEKEMLIGKLKNENGILIKTHILIRKENEELMKTIKLLQSDIKMKEETIKFTIEEAGVIKTQLNERESVIAKKDKAVVKVTKQNDVFKRELLFRDTTVQALLEKIEPKDNELKIKNNIIEEKTKEIEDLTKLKNKDLLEMEQLKKKLVLTAKELRRQKIQFSQTKALLRKIYLEIYLAASYVYQPQLLKETVIKMSGKFLPANKYDVQEDFNTYKEVMSRQYKMEKTIANLKNKLETKNVKVVHRPHKIAYKLLSEFNHIALELSDHRKKVNYLQTLLRLSLRKKSNKGEL